MLITFVLIITATSLIQYNVLDDIKHVMSLSGDSIGFNFNRTMVRYLMCINILFSLTVTAFSLFMANWIAAVASLIILVISSYVLLFNVRDSIKLVGYNITCALIVLVMLFVNSQF